MLFISLLLLLLLFITAIIEHVFHEISMGVTNVSYNGLVQK